jgi:hypothetical protein
MPAMLGRHVWLLALAVVALVAAVPSALASHAIGGPDVKVTLDNNNVEGGTPTPSFDSKNRQSNETSVAISGVSSSIVAAAANDYRMVPVFGDVWFGLYVSDNGGSTWFNTMVPGFPSDTSAAGTSSPLLGLDASGDPIVRFDAAGNLYAAGIAFNRNFDQPDRPVDNVVYVAKYNYTPGSPGGISTPNSAGNPPNFTYARTTIVDRGAVGFAVPSHIGFAGTFADKPWMEIDESPSSASPCSGNVYVAHTNFHGQFGSSPIVFSRSSDGGATWVGPRTISTGGSGGTSLNQGADIAVASDGTIYVAYQAFERKPPRDTVSVVRSTDCGKHWSQPVQVGPVITGQASGVAFRTPTFAFVAVDDTNPNLVYVAYQDLASGDYDIVARRSTNGGATWSGPVQVNTDPGARHQIFPTIEVSHNALHVGWYDFRNSVTPSNEALDVFYACTNCAGVNWPAFSHETRVTDVSHNGNCLTFGGGTSAFHGDYNELDAFWTGTNHLVNIAWADNRDVSPCDLDPAPGPPTNSTGNRNQNIYADRLTVSP